MEESVMGVVVRVGPTFKPVTAIRLLMQDEKFWVRERVTEKWEGKSRLNF